MLYSIKYIHPSHGHGYLPGRKTSSYFEFMVMQLKGAMTLVWVWKRSTNKALSLVLKILESTVVVGIIPFFFPEPISAVLQTNE